MLVVALLAGCDRLTPWQGVEITPPRPVPAFTFPQGTGRPFSTAPLPGRPLVLFFGYTHCPDVCPTTLADWVRVRRQLGASADRVRFVFVSVDPARDTPAVAAAYAARFSPTFTGVSGDSATTAGILAAFGATAVPAPSAGASGYLVSHSSQLFLVDDQGRLVAMYPFGTGWEALATDLEKLL
jgi:protein SCO1/2